MRLAGVGRGHKMLKQAMTESGKYCIIFNEVINIVIQIIFVLWEIIEPYNRFYFQWKFNCKSGNR